MLKLFNKILIITSLSVLAQAMGSNLPLSISTFGPQGSSSAPSSATSFLSQSVPVMASTTATQPSISATTTSDEKKESKESKEEKEEAKKQEKKKISTSALVQKEKDNETMTGEELHELGKAYFDGKEVEKDEKRAVALFKKAVDLGFAAAMVSLGVCYAYGDEVEKKDETNGFALIERAVKLGDAEALYCLGNLYGQGIGCEIDHFKAADLVVQASEKGFGAALALLGRWLLCGNNVFCIDQEAAVGLFQKAAEQNNYNGLLYLGYCYQQGLGITIDIAKAKDLLKRAAKQDGKKKADVKKWVQEQESNELGVRLEAQNVQIYSLINDSCPICKNKILAGQRIYRFDCIHGGHAKCCSKDSPKKCLICNSEIKAAFLGKAIDDRIATSTLVVSDEKEEARENKQESKEEEQEEKEKHNLRIAKLLKKEKGTMTNEELNDLGEAYLLGNGVKEKNEHSAFALFRQAANHNNPSAMKNLGYCYLKGVGVKKNEHLAVTWYKKALDWGYIDAKSEIYHALFKEEKSDICEVASVDWLLQAVHREIVDMQYQLGFNLLFGSHGFGVDIKAGIHWLQKAAKKNDCWAMFHLGTCYLVGFGMKRDTSKGKELISCASKTEGKYKGEVAQWMKEEKDWNKLFFKFRPENEQRFSLLNGACPICDNKIYPGLRIYRFDCKHGGHKACVEQWLKVNSKRCPQCKKEGKEPALGVSLISAENDEKKEKKEKKKKEEKPVIVPVEQIYQRALQLLDGNGVEKDQKEAVKLLTAAAEKGLAAAQVKLGDCLLQGIGVDEKDEKQAVKWFKEAKKYNSDAKCKLADCYRKGIGVDEKDEKKAFKLYEGAAAEGCAEAMSNLGTCLLNGIGCNVDSMLGVKSLRDASKKNHVNGMVRLWYCLEMGIGVKKDTKEAADITQKIEEKISKEEATAKYKELKRQRFGLVEGATLDCLNDNCTICQEELKSGSRMYYLTCGHWFHVTCIEPWLKEKNICPNCRKNVVEKQCVKDCCKL